MPFSPTGPAGPKSIESGPIEPDSIQTAARIRNLAFSVLAYEIVRCLLAVVFIVAGSIKLADPVSFAVIVDAFGILPRGLLMPVATALPLLEVIAGFCLLLDLRGSLAVLAGLVGLFLLVLGYAMAMGLDVECGCFGPEDPEGAAFGSIRPAFVRDLWLAAGVAYLYLWRWIRGRSPRPVRPFFKTLFRRKESPSR
ncbi:MAG: MauE/DoxX family redox-associated membrane protein [Desulfococcaceae bacterium]